jgi:hypothetical protein
MPKYLFDVSMDGLTSTRHEVEAADILEAVDVIGQRMPFCRWFDLARTPVKTPAFRLSEIVRREIEKPRGGTR